MKETELLEMELHTTKKISIDGGVDITILRVIGGWIYCISSMYGKCMQFVSEKKEQ